MEGIQVFSSKSLVLRRHVTVNGHKIFGEDEKGRTVLQKTTTSTRLYFSTESIAGGVLPWHFVCDNLSAFLGIVGKKHALLNSILATPDHTLIEDILERAGLFEYNPTVSADQPEHNGDINNGADGSSDGSPVGSPDETSDEAEADNGTHITKSRHGE